MEVLMERREGFWSGFGVGTIVGAAAGMGACLAISRSSSYDPHILRLEKSVQIGRSVEEVFALWSNLAQLPQRLSVVKNVDVRGQHSDWRVWIDGKEFSFDAETTQFLPNQAIGWKSVSGPKHSGRINFARLGNDTLVHVAMNYAPPLGRFGRLLAPITDHLESYIEFALRDFKRALEGEASDNQELGAPRRGPASAGWDEYREERRATGTEGGTETDRETSTYIPSQNRGVTRSQPGSTGDKGGMTDYTQSPESKH
jgi:uncharacterized membrane protein